MNLEDKHIDELFRNAANQSSAPEYQTTYWAEMEAMLNASQKRRKGLVFWTSLGSILMIGLITTLFLSRGSEALYNKADLVLEHERNTSEMNDYQLVSTEKTTSNPVVQNKQENINRLSIASTGAGALKTNQNNSGLQQTKIQDKKEIDKQGKPFALVVSSLPLKNYRLSLGSIRMNSDYVDNSVLYPSTKNSKSLSKSIELGAGIAQAYDNSKSHPTLLSAALKLNYRKKDFLFSTGAGISVEQNVGITVSERAKVYGFGVTNFENSLNYKTLVDITVPLQFAYQKGGNTFGIGTQFCYLAGSSMRFESKENGQTMLADNLTGITTGLNPLNVDAYGFYERSIGKNISLGVRISQQLTSRIADDNYFNNLDRNRTLNGQVYLKYSIFTH